MILFYMKKILIGLIFLISAFSLAFAETKESMMHRSIPDSELVGAANNIRLSVEEPAFDGASIKAIGIIPYNTKSEQLRPSFLACMRSLMMRYPNSRSIIIYFTPDKRLLNIPGYMNGGIRFSYREKQITLSYNIPSDQQIKARNALRGKNIFIGTDEPTLHRMDRKTFDKGMKVLVTYSQVDKELSAKQHGGIIDNDQIFPIVAKRLGISKQKAESLEQFMYNYYELWGTETITLY